VGLWREEKKDENTIKQEDDKENKTTQSSNEVEQAVSKICIYIYNIIDRNEILTHNCMKFCMAF